MRRRSQSRTHDPLDDWLEEKGYFRKQIARDGSCLFRAVAEKVMKTQTKHELVRQKTLDYMETHTEEFQPFCSEPIDHHIHHMRKTNEWGGHLEIICMSKIFQLDFVIYSEIGKSPQIPTCGTHVNKIYLAYTHGNHYDLLYTKTTVDSMGFVQSMLYENLYANVLNVKDPLSVADKMLHDNEYFRHDSSNSTEMKEISAIVEKVIASENNKEANSSSTDDKSKPEDKQESEVKTPQVFTYRVAKSLDPYMYRNIEYDIWQTSMKEAKYGPFDANGFKAGVKVIIKLELLPNRAEVEAMRKENFMARNSPSVNDKQNKKGDQFHGHIQEMTDSNGEVTVFVEEIGAKIKVPYEALEKLPPSPPRSPWHSQNIGSQPSSNMNGGQNYKNLTGFYQKAPLQEYNNSSVGRGKRKITRQPPEMYSSMQGPPTGPRHMSNNGPNNTMGRGASMRGRGYPRGYNSRGFGRGAGGQNRSYSMPEEDYPSLPTSGMPHTPRNEGAWGNKNNNNYSYSNASNKNNQPKFHNNYNKKPQHTSSVNNSSNYNNNNNNNNSSSHVTGPIMDFGLGPNPSIISKDSSSAAEVTQVLQQVMSAGGQQEVIISGQKLEVVAIESNNQDKDKVTEVTSKPQEYEKDTNNAQIEEVGNIKNESQHYQEAVVQPTPPPPVPSGIQPPPHPVPSVNGSATPGVKSPESTIEEATPVVSPAVSTAVMMTPYPVEQTVPPPPPQQQIVSCSSSSTSSTPQMYPMPVYVSYPGYGNQGGGWSLTPVPIVPNNAAPIKNNTTPGATEAPYMAQLNQDFQDMLHTGHTTAAVMWGSNVIPQGSEVPYYSAPPHIPQAPSVVIPPQMINAPPHPPPAVPFTSPVPQYMTGNDGGRDHPRRGGYGNRGRGGRGGHHNVRNYQNQGPNSGHYNHGNNRNNHNNTNNNNGTNQRSLPPRFQRGGMSSNYTYSNRGGRNNNSAIFTPPQVPPHYQPIPFPATQVFPHGYQLSQYEGKPLFQMATVKANNETMSSQVVPTITANDTTKNGLTSPSPIYTHHPEVVLSPEGIPVQAPLAAPPPPHPPPPAQYPDGSYPPYQVMMVDGTSEMVYMPTGYYPAPTSWMMPGHPGMPAVPGPPQYAMPPTQP